MYKEHKIKEPHIFKPFINFKEFENYYCNLNVIVPLAVELRILITHKLVYICYTQDIGSCGRHSHSLLTLHQPR